MSNDNPHLVKALHDVERLKRRLHDVKATLAYVAYARLPLGNTVFDTLQEHWQLKVIQDLDMEPEETES